MDPGKRYSFESDEFHAGHRDQSRASLQPTNAWGKLRFFTNPNHNPCFVRIGVNPLHTIASEPDGLLPEGEALFELMVKYVLSSSSRANAS